MYSRSLMYDNLCCRVGTKLAQAISVEHTVAVNERKRQWSPVDTFGSIVI